MSAIMTEVVSDHPWSAAMQDASRAHQADRRSFEPHYRTSSTQSASSSSSRRTQSRSSSSLQRNLSTSSTLVGHDDNNGSEGPQDTPQQAPSAIQARSASLHSRSTSNADPAPTPQDQPPSPSLSPIRNDDSDSSQDASTDGSESSEKGQSVKKSRYVKIESLQQIRELAGKEMGTADTDMPKGEDGEGPGQLQYDISGMNPMEIIEMVAGLLTKMTTTNDEHYDYLHRSIPPPDVAAGLSQQTTSVWAFHGKNVPSITILSYLGRIQKYCPATYEVFLSLLVYFDRMTERVNTGQMQSLRQLNEESLERSRSGLSQRNTSRANRSSADITPPYSESGLAEQRPHPSTPRVSVQEPPSPPLSDSDPTNLSSFFVVDSYNIHRLVIAGVTCAAKFFSDVFFTNSRYAKVGGLPLIELNHLELQFLLLNDFRLAIPVEELEQYGTMLVEFYARETLAQRQTESASAA